MHGISVIMPFCNESPQIQFTLQSLVDELSGGWCNFEIIAINNYVDLVASQGFLPDGGWDKLERLSNDGVAPYLKLLWYKDKLSHWNAKNRGISEAQYDTLFFCDAHVMLKPGSLFNMANCFWASGSGGSMHLPIRYLNDKPGRELVYMTVTNQDLGLLHYRFLMLDQAMKHEQGPSFTIPAMSTCGMMISKELLWDKLHGWPSLMGIYGGGENYLNFVMGVLGYEKRIFVDGVLHHYAAPRGYHYEHFDWVKNRLLAVYLFGGEEWAVRCAEGILHTGERGSHRQIYQMLYTVLEDAEATDRRNTILREQKFTPMEWLDKQKQERPHLITEAPSWK